MKFQFRGPFDPYRDYLPGDIFSRNGKSYVVSRDGSAMPTAAKPDPVLDRIAADGRDGVDGVGRDGKDGADAKAFRPRGAYKRKNYEALDMVEHLGSSYICVTATRLAPPNKAWQLLAKAGAAGKDGHNGSAVKGARGRGVHWTGPFSATRHYSQDELVEFDGNVYIAVVSHTSTAPPSGEWNLFTAGGSGGGFEPTPAIFDSDALKGFAVFVSSDGHVDNAIATAAATAGVVGICAGDVAAGNAGQYITEGAVTRDDWTPVAGTEFLAPGAYYYLSALSAGQITSVAPTTDTQLVAPIGRAQSTTQLDCEFSQAVLL